MSCRMATCSSWNRWVSNESFSSSRISPAPPRKARSALRITATSMTSWRIAPQTAGRRPTAATPMAAKERAIPATMLSMAICRVRRAMRCCLTQAVQPIDSEHHIGGFGRSGCPSSPEGDSDVGERECGCIVDAVTDHHGRSPARLELHDVELLGRRALSQHLVDPDDRPDGLGHIGSVAGDHHDAGDPVLPQRAKGPGGVGSQRIIEDQDTGRSPVDAHEHGESARRDAPYDVPSGPSVGAPVTPAHDAFPTATRCPATVPRMPWPGISSTLSGRESSHFCSRAD